MKVFVYIWLGVMLSGCVPKNVSVSEACQVLRITLYPDGKFVFTQREIDNLREVNQIKIVSVKNWYRSQCIR